MEINKLLTGMQGKMPTGTVADETSSNLGFQDIFKQAMGSVDENLNSSEAATASLALGDGLELHQVMLAAEQASLSLQLTVQVRNKILEAYQEVMRMQV